MVTLIITFGAPCSTVRAQAVASTSATSGTAADTGFASLYGRRLGGKKTASGERLDNGAMVAAHPTLPLGSVVRVTNLDNGRTVDVRIVDRGPSKARVAKGYIIDLSRAAARALRFRRRGKAHVSITVLQSRR